MRQPPAKPPGDWMLRACFWLVAVVVVAVMSMAVAGVAACVVGVWVGKIPVGSCAERGIYEEIHNWWTEILTAILALLVASRSGPPPPPPGDEE